MVFLVLAFFLFAPSPCAGAAFCDFVVCVFLLHVAFIIILDDACCRSVAFCSQHVASKSILTAPAQCFMIVYNSNFWLEKGQVPKTCNCRTKIVLRLQKRRTVERKFREIVVL